MAWLMSMPGFWMAKSSRVVVPPKRAARLTCSGGAVLKFWPWTTKGAAMWAWGSIPPGTTILPEASMTRPASSVNVPGAATATIFSPCTATSQSPTPQGVTTWPPRIIRSSMVVLLGMLLGKLLDRPWGPVEPGQQPRKASLSDLLPSKNEPCRNDHYMNERILLAGSELV